MNPRPKGGKRLVSGKSGKAAKSFNFFRGCSSSARPDWGTEITHFKVLAGRVRPKA